MDVELVDGHGRSYLKPKALFYGRLEVNRVLETEVADIDVLEFLNPVRLPPGGIVDLASDADLQLIYVLGRPENSWSVNPMDIKSPGSITDPLGINQTYYPGWISVVHYDRNDLANAAPMHRLGYYDLPKDTQPSAMALGRDALYVFSQGYRFNLLIPCMTAESGCRYWIGLIHWSLYRKVKVLIAVFYSRSRCQPTSQLPRR